MKRWGMMALWVAAGMAWAEPLYEVIYVPKERFTAYTIEPPGADLVLDLKAVDGYEILWHDIRCQDWADCVQWIEDTTRKNSYKLFIPSGDPSIPLMKKSSREWLAVTGGIARVTGGGSGGPSQTPLFEADVLSVNLDFVNVKRADDTDNPDLVDETREETVGAYVGLTGPLTPLVIEKIECREIPAALLDKLPVKFEQESQKQVRVWTNATRSGTPITLPHVYMQSELPRTNYVEVMEASEEERDLVFKVGCRFEKLANAAGTQKRWVEAIDRVKMTVLKVDLDIWNGGSDLDNGQTAGSQGAQVPEGSEVSTGAYVLVNWDDDDDTPTDFTTSPTPDLNQMGSVNNEDNLAKLKPTVEPLLDTGTMELEVSGTDAGKVKLWTQSTKGTPVTLTSNKKIWNLASSTEMADFQTFVNDGYWIEGMNAGTAERAVTFTVRYKDNGGTEICKDDNKATVVMLELGVGAYRENAVGLGMSQRGHGGLLFRYDGQCLKSDLTNDLKFSQLEMPGLTVSGPKVRTLTYATHYPDETPPPAYYGLCRPANLGYAERLKILKAAYYLKDNGGSIWYVGVNVIEIDGTSWGGTTVNEKLDDVDALRCDGLIELCYEINGINAWGKIVSGNTHYSIYTYTSEHNEPGWVPAIQWEKYLQPFTQCAKSTTYKGTLWDTTFSLIPGKTKPSLGGP